MEKSISFLKQIKKNNDREWFLKNKPKYDSAKQEFEIVVQNVINNISKFDPIMTSLVAKKTLFRINRDVRFSKDKSPYKTNFGANLNPGGKNNFTSGYYLHIEPGKSFLAGGCYMPMPDKLSAIRQEIDYNYTDFKKILAHKDFKKYFNGLSDEEKLVNPPKGYDKENPAVEVLKYKHFIALHHLDDKDLLNPKFASYAASAFKAMYPFILFLRKAVE